MPVFAIKEHFSTDWRPSCFIGSSLLKLCQFLHETLQRYSLVLLGNCQRLTKRRCELTQRLYLWCLRRDKTMSTLEKSAACGMIDANQLKRIILRRPLAWKMAVQTVPLLRLLTSAGVLFSTTARVRGSMTNSITAHHSTAHPPDPLETCSPAASPTTKRLRLQQPQQPARTALQYGQRLQQPSFSWFRTCRIGINRLASLESTPQQPGWEFSAASSPGLQLALMEVPDLCTRCDDLAPVHSRAYRVRGASKLSCQKHGSVTHALRFPRNPYHTRCAAPSRFTEAEKFKALDEVCDCTQFAQVFPPAQRHSSSSFTTSLCAPSASWDAAGSPETPHECYNPSINC